MPHAPLILPSQPSPQATSPATAADAGSETSFSSVLAGVNEAGESPKPTDHNNSQTADQHKPDAEGNHGLSRSNEQSAAESAAREADQRPYTEHSPAAAIAALSESPGFRQAQQANNLFSNGNFLENNGAARLIFQQAMGTSSQATALTGIDLDAGTVGQIMTDSKQPQVAVNINVNGQPVALQDGKNEPIISAQLQQLINGNEKGVVTISHQSQTSVSFNSLETISQPLRDFSAAGTNQGGGQALVQSSSISVNQQVAISSSSIMSSTTVSTAQASVQVQQGQTDQPLVSAISQLTTVTDSSTSAATGLATGQAITAQAGVVQESVGNLQATNDNRAPHLRQDVQGQYFDAKLEAGAKSQNGDETAGNQQQSSQQETANTQQSQSTAPGTPAAAASETSHSYSQVSQGVLDTPVTKPGAITQPVAPVPGSMVNDEAIVQQVAQRFNIQARNQETLINIRLHPAELGELKIDLTFREGAVRAHVIAQSQHVQEVLEKNMPRLRELLQGQGIQVEDIQISAKSDIAGDFDLLQEQLAKRDNPGQQEKQQFEKEDFIDTLESIGAADTVVDQQGVNVTA